MKFLEGARREKNRRPDHQFSLQHGSMSTYKLLKTIGVVTKQVEQLTHKQRVVRVYRALLKNSLNWTISRDKWYPIASEIKGEFKRNKYETNPATIDALVAKAENRLEETRHPDPYISMQLIALVELS